MMNPTCRYESLAHSNLAERTVPRLHDDDPLVGFGVANTKSTRCPVRRA